MDSPTLPRAPRTTRLGAALLLMTAAACADATDSGQKPRVTPPGADGALAVLTCRAQVADRSVECFADGDGRASALLSPGNGPSKAAHTIGGQGSYVRLASTNITEPAGRFEFDVTVQNLANLAMGTSDGATPDTDGLRVFFHTEPVASPTGSVTVAGADGSGDFTGPSQSYYQYAGSTLGADGLLSSAEVSGSKHWAFDVSPGVQTFTFQVYVQTETPDGDLETVAPQVSAVSASPLVPGSTVTLDGVNFNATPASNVVRIGGATATVTAASATQLTVVVPCVVSGTVGIDVQANNMRGVALARTLAGYQRTLGVGESVIVTNTAEVGCNELTATGEQTRYLVSVFNSNTSPTSSAPFLFSGDGPTAAVASIQAPASVAAPVTPGLTLDGYVAEAAQRTADARHAELLEKNRVAYEQGMAKFRGDSRMRASRNVIQVDPALTRTFRVSNINASNFCNNYYVVSATRVFFDGKIAIYEDDATPDAFKIANNPTMAANYTKIGNQFNTDMEPIIRNNFGDILRRDALTDNNGVLIALFTPRINNSFSGVAGFVVSCDQFPNDDTTPSPAVGGPYTGTGTFGSSNHGEFFYAYQPVTAGTGYSGNTADNWYRTIRSTFIHESKHVASNAARVANNAPAYEVGWLEEGTARHSEELWMRNAVDNVAWKANTGYGSAANPINVYCDVRPGFAECDANTRRPASIMQRHFTSLYTHMFNVNGRLLSPFGATPSDNASYYYAISWSLVRFAIDRYGTSDAAFLTALTQSTTTGATNLAARAGTSIDNVLGGWALSLAADDYPGLTTSNPDLKMQTWNFRAIYGGLNADLPGTYTLGYPLTPTQLSFGTFAIPSTSTATMRGGGVLWYNLSGTQTRAQLLKLTGTGGATVPGTIRVAVARLQ